MTNKKTELSQETKTEIKGIVQGIYSEGELELIPTITKREEKFADMVKALKDGKFYVLHVGTPQNSIYPMIKKFKEKENLDVVWSKVKAKDGTVQFALFLKKDNPP